MRYLSNASKKYDKDLVRVLFIQVNLQKCVLLTKARIARNVETAIFLLYCEKQ